MLSLESSHLNNELKILPLRRYAVTTFDYAAGFGQGGNVEDVFTADHHNVNDTGTRFTFYRTGNIVREYFGSVNKIIVTPVDAEEIPA